MIALYRGRWGYLKVGLTLILSSFFILPWASAQDSLSSTYCGIYCVYALALRNNQDVDFTNLIRPEFLSTERGSTLGDLQRASTSCKLDMVPISQLSISSLARLQRASILHWRTDLTDVEYDHYVVFFGTVRDQFVVLDPPNALSYLTGGEVAAHWDGSGLVFRDDLAIPQRLSLYLDLRFVAPLLLLVVFMITRKLASAKPIASYGNLRVTFAEVMVLANLAFALSLFAHTRQYDGFITTPSVLENIAVANIKHIAREIDYEQVKSYLDSGTAIPVDARLESDYTVGHLQGSRNIEPFLNLTECRARLDDLPLNTPIIIYCQSSGCSYARIVAGKLWQLGYRKLFLYTEGWVDWQQSQQLTKSNAALLGGH